MPAIPSSRPTCKKGANLLLDKGLITKKPLWDMCNMTQKNATIVDSFPYCGI